MFYTENKTRTAKSSSTRRPAGGASRDRERARSFRNAAPSLSNRLPDKLHRAKDTASFRRQLKAHAFNFVISSPPSSYPLPTSFSPYCHFFPLSPCSIFFAKRNELVVFLHGVRTALYKRTLTLTSLLHSLCYWSVLCNKPFECESSKLPLWLFSVN